jgi:hypothetical protein
MMIQRNTEADKGPQTLIKTVSLLKVKVCEMHRKKQVVLNNPWKETLQ